MNQMLPASAHESAWGSYSLSSATFCPTSCIGPSSVAWLGAVKHSFVLLFGLAKGSLLLQCIQQWRYHWVSPLSNGLIVGLLSGLANELAYGKGLASGPPPTIVPFGSQLCHPTAQPCFQCQHVGVQRVLTSEQWNVLPQLWQGPIKAQIL